MAGYIETISAREISGWSDIEGVEVLVNGKKVGIAAVTGVRQDCVDAGFPNARGLFFRPTRYLVPGQNTIVLRNSADQSTVTNGNGVITYDPNQQVDDHWSEQYSKPQHIISRWWQCQQITDHVIKKISDLPASDILMSVRRWLASEYSSKLPFDKAISVGGGTGNSELAVIKDGLVRHFDLYEMSSYAVQSGIEMAKEQGLAEAMSFYHMDAFGHSNKPEVYDLVFWQQALHHMPDADAALSWSYKVLKPGGVLVMHEYVGPTRMQFRQGVLDANTEFRRSLDPRYLVNPWAPDQQIPAKCENSDLDELIFMDPSEGVDAGNILPSLAKYFPDAKVKLTGGIIYHLGLNDILHNLVTDGRIDDIRRALELDDRFIHSGETQYAVALAEKT
jgi:ubiquinone/menaquinone biosynthesis C-methylase UbiE